MKVFKKIFLVVLLASLTLTFAACNIGKDPAGPAVDPGTNPSDPGTNPSDPGTNPTDPQCDHDHLVWVEEVAATEAANGMKGHYYCEVCKKYFDSDKQEVTRESLVIEFVPEPQEDFVAARKYIFTLYNKFNNTESAADWDVIAKIIISDISYEIEWTLVVDEGEQNDVKLVKSEDGTKVTIDVNEDAVKATKYTVTGQVKGSDEKITVTRTIPAFAYTTFEQWKENCDAGSSKTLIIKGYVITVVAAGSSSAGSFYLQDADGHGYYAYSPVAGEAIAYGDEVVVKGTGTVYGGQYEFNKGCTYEKTGEHLDTLPAKDGTADWAAATSQKDTSLIPYQNALVKLTGCSMNIIDGSYYYFTVGESEVKFNVYDTYYFISEADRKVITDQWQYGYTFDVYGIVSCYSNLYQIYPIAADALSNVAAPKLSDADAVALVKEGLALSQVKFEDPGQISVITSGNEGQVTVAWAADNAQITFADGKMNVVLGADDVSVKVTATLTAGETTDTKEFIVVVSGDSADQYLPEIVETVAAGKYVITIDQTAQAKDWGGKVLYATGEINSKGALVTTDKGAKAALFTIAAVEGKENTYTIQVGDKYLVAYRNGTYNNMKLDDNAGEWNWDETLKAFTAKISYKAKETDTDDTVITVYFGAYAYTNKETGAVTGLSSGIALSETKYVTGDNAAKIGVTQFVGHIATLKPAEFVFNAQETIAAGKYVISIDQTAQAKDWGGKVLYATGEINSKGALVTTDKGAKAALFTIAAVEGKENTYTIQVGDKYLVAYRNGTYNNMKLDDNAGEWNWDETLKAFTAKISYKAKETDTDDTVITVYFGAYAYTNKETGAVTGLSSGIALSETKYVTGDNAAKIGVTQFVGHIGNLSLKEIKFFAQESAVAGQYIISIDQTAQAKDWGGKVLFATGEINSKGALVTTDKVSKAALFTIAAVEGKENTYTIQVGDKYLVAYRNGTYNNMKLDDNAGEWNWDETLKAFTAKISYKAKETDTDDTVITVYFGAYAYTNKETGAVTGLSSGIALSETKYVTGDNAAKIGVTQFVGHIGKMGFVSEEPEQPQEPEPAKADLTILDDGTIGTDYVSANWKVQKYSNGWVDVTSVQMRCREKDGVKVVNFAAGWSVPMMYTYSGTDDASLGVADILTFKVGNYFSGAQEMKVKLILVDKDGNKIFLMGDANNWATMPVTTGLVDQRFVFEAKEIKQIIIVTNSPMQGSAYLYVSPMHLGYEENPTVHVGTEADPYSVADALLISKDYSNSKYDNTNKVNVYGDVKEIIVKGYVVNAGTDKGDYIQNIKIADAMDSTTSLLIYTMNETETLKDVYVGDLITVKGYIMKYNGTFEISSYVKSATETAYPAPLAIVRGTNEVKVASSVANATVSEITPAQGENGSEFTFKVAPADGYKIEAVKVNGIAVTEAEGVYKGKIAGPTEISVVAVDANKPTPVKAADFSCATIEGQDITYVNPEGKTNADKAATKMTWVQNGITLVVEKDKSSTSCNNNNGATYVNPLRLYKDQKMTISYSGIVKVVFNMAADNGSTSYTTGLSGAKWPEGATVEVFQAQITVTFATPVDSFTVSGIAAAARMNAFEVYTLPAE